MTLQVKVMFEACVILQFKRMCEIAGQEYMWHEKDHCDLTYQGRATCEPLVQIVPDLSPRMLCCLKRVTPFCTPTGFSCCSTT